MQLVIPDYGQHVLFIGSTGCGKSSLAEAMLQQTSRIFAIDTQDSVNVEGTRIRSPDDLRLNFMNHYDRLHYVPDPEYLTRNHWDNLFRRLLLSSTKRKKNKRIVYVDEIFHVGFGSSFPSWVSKSVTTARQRGLSYWISAQRPKNIPQEILSEASLIYVFYLTKFDDMKYLSGFARDDNAELLTALKHQKKDYSFLCIDNHNGTWQKYNKLGGIL